MIGVSAGALFDTRCSSKLFEEEGTSVGNCAAVQIDTLRQEKMNENILLSLLEKKLRKRILYFITLLREKNDYGNIFIFVHWSARWKNGQIMGNKGNNGRKTRTLDWKGNL